MTPPKPPSVQAPEPWPRAPRPESRPGSAHDDRDVYEPKHPQQLAVPHEVEPEKTGVGQAPSPELLEARRRRTPSDQLERVLDYARTAEQYRHERELREAAAEARAAELEAKERATAKRRQWIIALIAAVGAAIAGIVAAVH